ncbi:MAG: BatA domain-containing protein [Phycisphaerae bacterium]|nr:BatA domain-containing protein [Phycisphaerae bacterium]
MSLVFVHTGFALAAAGLIAVPVLIHLLSRRRQRDEPWAAMTFLLAAQRRSRRRLWIDEWLLLALRMLIVAAAGLAVARPALSRSALARAIGEPRNDRVIVLDDSLSMQARHEDGRSAFDVARDLALHLLNGLSEKDAVGLIVTSGGGRAVIDRPTLDRGVVRRALEELQCTYATADVQGALATAREVLRRGDAAPDAQAAYLLTDAARTTWKSRGDDAASTRASHDSVAEAFAALAGPASRYVVNTGALRRGNLAITRVGSTARWATAGAPLTVEAEIRGFDARPSPQAGVVWELDGVIVRRESLSDWPDSGLRRVECTLRPRQPGAHVVNVRLDPSGDVLPADEARAWAFHVAADLPVLIVSGGTGGRGPRDEAFYLSLALSPRQALSEHAAPASLFAPRVVSDVELPARILEDYRAVVLANVARPSPQDWARLARFVTGGGGLLVCLGDRVDTDAYNTSAGPGAAGAPAGDLLPAMLDRAFIGDAQGSGVRLRIDDPTHAIAAEFTGHVGGGLLTTPIRGHVPVGRGARRTAGARTILSYDNGDAALLEQTFGRGRVLLWTTSADMDWSNLPAKPDFLPLIVNMVAHLVSDAAASLNAPIGAAYSTAWSRDASGATPIVLRPDGRREPAAIEERADSPEGRVRAVLVYDRTDLPGAYAVEGGPASARFAVAADAGESDLSPMSENELRRRLGAPFVYLDNPTELLRRPADSPRFELSGTLFAVVLVLLLGETLIAAIFGTKT